MPALPQHQSMPVLPTSKSSATPSAHVSIDDDDDFADEFIRPPLATVSAAVPSSAAFLSQSASSVASSSTATVSSSSTSSVGSIATAPAAPAVPQPGVLPVRALRRHPADVVSSPSAVSSSTASNLLRFSRERLNTLTAEQEQLLAAVPPVELVNSSSTKGHRLDNRVDAPGSSDDELPRRRPSRQRHSVEMACDLLDTIREDYREQVERAYWSIVQDRAMWDEQLNIIEVVPMAGTMKHKQDRFAFTFVRVDGAVVMRIDREDIVTLHVTNPSMVQKVILEQLVSHIGWHWAVLNLATQAEIDKMRHKKVNASGGDAPLAPLDPDTRVMQLIDASTGEWCALSKPVRIRLPAAVAHQRRFWRKQNRRRARETREAMDAHVTRRGFRSLGISLRRVAIRKKVMRDLLSESPRAIRLSLSRRLSTLAARDDDDDDFVASAAAAAAAAAAGVTISSSSSSAVRNSSSESIGRVSAGDTASLTSANTATDDDDLDFSDVLGRQDQPLLFHHRPSVKMNEAELDAEELRLLRRGRSSLF
jgi:hypothetical protein